MYKTRILSPMSLGNGAHVVHKQLEARLSGYRVCGYHPGLTVFPPLLRFRCREGQPGLIHTTPDYAPLFQRKGVPLVITFHNYVLDPEIRCYGSVLQRLHWSTDLRLLTRVAVGRAHCVTAVSQYTADLVRSDLGYQGVVEVIPNGVATDQFCPGTGKGKGPIRVLFSGNPNSRKGAQWLGAIADRLDRGVELICTAGLRGNAHVGNERISWLGPVPYDAMSELYQSADILLLPTVREGHSLAVLEAMASGLPVVSSNCSSLPEQIEEGKGGYLVAVGDIEGYADAINRLAENRPLRRMMREFNRERAEQSFGMQRMVDTYRNVFDRLLSNNLA